MKGFYFPPPMPIKLTEQYELARRLTGRRATIDLYSDCPNESMRDAYAWDQVVRLKYTIDSMEHGHEVPIKFDSPTSVGMAIDQAIARLVRCEATRHAGTTGCETGSVDADSRFLLQRGAIDVGFGVLKCPVCGELIKGVAYDCDLPGGGEEINRYGPCGCLAK